MKLSLIAFVSLPALATIHAAEPAPPSLSLDALVREISAAHPELAFYQAELDAAKASRRSAGALADPELSVEAGRKRVRDPLGGLAGEGTAWTVTLAQSFEWPGRIALRKAIANRDVALAELGLARFKSALAARTQALAISVDGAQRRSAALGEVAGRFSALKDVFLARDPAGITPLLETRVIEAQELALQRRATEAALAEQTARAELNQLRGSPPQAPLAVALPRAQFAASPPMEELLAAARERDFDYRSRLIEVEQQGYAVQLARHERYPSVTVSPFYSRENAGDRESIVGVGLSLPLPLTNRTRHQADVAEARRRQAEALAQRAARDLERDVLAAAQAFEAKATETRRWAPDAVDRFREAAALADRHYRLGAVPLATYVELQTAYLDAVEALLDTRREALEAAARLHLLTGRELITWEAAR